MAAVRTTGSDERGQVQSSLVAVAAVAAVIAGLLLLFGTGGTDGRTAAQETTPTPTVAPATTGTPTAVPSTPAQTPTRPATTAPATTRPASTHPATTQPVATSTRPVVTGPRPRIEIYNNTTRHGLADEVANRARALGWTVAGIDNWRGKVAGSTVYYPPGMMDHAAALSGDLEVGRIKAALDNMKTDRLTVILTSDYAG